MILTNFMPYPFANIMKQVTLIIFLTFGISALAQDNWCGTDAKLEEAYQANPDLRRTIAAQIVNMRQSMTVSDRSDSLTIPVVFHIVHDNGIGNISQAQILDAMRMINEDFNRTHADATNTRNTTNAPFAPVAANMKICFELAKIDPNGDCTNGVQRRNSPAASYNGNDNTTKKFNGGGLDVWDRSKYFNIWVVNTVQSSSANSITLGYAQFPYFGNPANYGVIIRHDRVGSIGTATVGDRTLTHEIGHCFGLFHTFQSGCGTNSSDCSSQGDFCCDTPPVSQAQWSCATNQNNCSQVPLNDYYGFDAYDQFENFMSYSPCQNMFSNDQKSIVFNNFDDFTWLANLATASNLVATGVSLPSTLCNASFEADRTIICAGDQVAFSDMSYSNVTARNWTFAGGNPSTSTDSLTIVTYNTPGNYTVSISVTDGVNTENTSKTSYITVLPAIGAALPLKEGFETITFPDNQNFFSSKNGTVSDWEITSNGASLGAKSLFYDNFNKGSENAVVTFESGPIDLSTLSVSDQLYFTFDYAYSKRSSFDSEALRVYISNDCGETWITRLILSGNLLGDDFQFSSYNASSADFSRESLTVLANSDYVSNFRYKFEFSSDGGNNIFIDNINISTEAPLSVNEIDNNEAITLYPNPVKTTLNIGVGTVKVESFQIINSGGQLIMSETQPTINANRLLNIDTEELARGIYYITLINKKQVITKKFIK